MRFLPLLLLLTSCSSQTAQEKLLEDYAAMSFSQSAEIVLSGEALVASEAAREKLDEHGYRQVGRARFEILQQLTPRALIACLDVSDIKFFDAMGQVDLGEPVAPQRVEIWLDDTPQGKRISSLNPTGEPC